VAITPNVQGFVPFHPPHLNPNIKSGRHGATSRLNPNNWSVAKPGVMWSGVRVFFL